VGAVNTLNFAKLLGAEEKVGAIDKPNVAELVGVAKKLAKLDLMAAYNAAWYPSRILGIM
jgi:hypothetical protein